MHLLTTAGSAMLHIVFLSGCAAQSMVLSTDKATNNCMVLDSSSLKMSIHASKQAFVRGETKILHLDILNTNKTPVSISDPKFYVSTQLALLKDGLSVPAIKVKPDNSKKDILVTIKPFDIYKSIYSYELDKYFSYLPQGEYDLQANYSGYIFINNLSVSHGSIVSNVVHFSVK